MSQIHSQKIQEVLKKANTVILDKDTEIKLALTCLFAKGHLLIEDSPGVGKTTLAQAITKLLGLQLNRIQFTSDLLPSDIVGNMIFNNQNQNFEFYPGPIFSQVVLADELNRTNPRTQSALLEAMEEEQVTVDRQSHALPKPFLVIATQNPQSQVGTFALPESQLDRFLMSLELKPAERKSELKLIQGSDPRIEVKKLTAILRSQEVEEIQNLIPEIFLSETVAEYIMRILEKARQQPQKYLTLSTRTGQALARASRAWAFLHQRNHVLPDDVKSIAQSVLSHRLGGPQGIRKGQVLVHELLQEVTVPI